MRLFERGSSELRVTPVGERIVAQAVRVLEEAAMLRELADQLLPHQHFVKADRGATNFRAKGLRLVVVALAQHNVPEGLAVGAGNAGGESLRQRGFATGDLLIGFAAMLILSSNLA